MKGLLVIAIYLVVVFVSCVICQEIDCPFAPSVPEDRRVDKTVLKLATFNIYWLFDGEFPETDISPMKDNPSKAAFHMQKAAEQVKALDADILALQEVEDCGVLATFNDNYLQGLGYQPYVIQGTDTATGQDVGILTRVDPYVDLVRSDDRQSIPVAGSSCSTSSGTTSSSKNLLAKFKLSSFTLDLIVSHLKSGGQSSDCAKREGQALILSRLWEDSGSPISNTSMTVIVGDLNDLDNEERDAKNKIASSKTLEQLKSIPGNELQSVIEFIPQNERLTSSFGMIDHILFSKNFLNLMVDAGVDGSIDTGSSTGERVNNGYSDHYPVYVVFRDDGESVDTPGSSGESQVWIFAVVAGGVILILLAVVFIVKRVKDNPELLAKFTKKGGSSRS